MARTSTVGIGDLDIDSTGQIIAARVDGQLEVYDNLLNLVSTLPSPFSVSEQIVGFASEPTGLGYGYITQDLATGIVSLYVTPSLALAPILVSQAIGPPTLMAPLGLDLVPGLNVAVVNDVGVGRAAVYNLDGSGTGVSCVYGFAVSSFGISHRRGSLIEVVDISPIFTQGNLVTYDMSTCTVVDPLGFDLFAAGFSAGLLSFDRRPISGAMDQMVLDDFVNNQIVLVELPEAFLRGDVNVDGVLTLTDVIALATFLFGGGPPLLCLDAGDIDDSNTISLTDIIQIANFLFGGGPPPAAPFPNCGQDPTPDTLTCDEHVCP